MCLMVKSIFWDMEMGIYVFVLFLTDFIKNMGSVKHSITLGDIFIHSDEHRLLFVS